MAESTDQRLQDYQERLQELLDSARESVERQAPDVLDKLATTARNIAERLEGLASEARQRQAGTEASPEPTGASEPTRPDAPPAPKPEA